MTAPPAPPRLSLAILQRALPADVRDDALGDLNEVFRRDVTTLGLASAQRRYRRKALSFAVTFLAERLRDGWTSLVSTRASRWTSRGGANS